MPKYHVTDPQGQTFEITAPEGASEDQVLAYAKQQFAPRSAAMRDATKREASVSGPEMALGTGITAGLGSDIDAASAAGETGLNNLARKLEGKDSVGYGMKDAFSAVKDINERKAKAFDKAHPVAAPLTELGGALMTPGIGSANTALKGAGLTSGVARSALIGGGLGGVNAFGSSRGSLGDKLKAIPGGAAVGGVTGGSLHGLARLAPRLAASASGAAGEGARAIKDVFDAGTNDASELLPDQIKRGAAKGEAYIGDLAKKLDPTGQKLAASPVEKVGKPVTAAEALGRPGVTQLKVMGRRMGETPDKLEAQLYGRSKELPDRVINDFRETTGIDPEMTRGDMVASAEKMRQAATGPRAAWYAQGALDSPELRELRDTDQIKKAIKKAHEFVSADRESAYAHGLHGVDELPEEKLDLNTGKPTVVMQNGKPVMLKRQVALDRAKARGFTHSMENVDGEESQPLTAKGWEYVKRGLDQQLSKYRDPVTKKLDLSSPAAQALVKVRRELGAELTNPKQPWGAAGKAAFDASGEPIRMEKAFNDAKSLLSTSVPGHRFDQRIKQMTPDERQALKAGVASEVADAARAGKKQLRSLLTDTTIMKLRDIYGKDVADKLVERLEMEMQLSKTGARMAPGVGSDTSETLMGSREQTEAIHNVNRAARSAWHGNLPGAIVHLLGGPIGGAYRGAQAPINEAARNRSGALLSMKPSELAAVLKKLEQEKRKMGLMQALGHGVKKSGIDPVPRVAQAAGQQAGGLASNP